MASSCPSSITNPRVPGPSPNAANAPKHGAVAADQERDVTRVSGAHPRTRLVDQPQKRLLIEQAGVAAYARRCCQIEVAGVAHPQRSQPLGQTDVAKHVDRAGDAAGIPWRTYTGRRSAPSSRPS